MDRRKVYSLSGILAVARAGGIVAVLSILAVVFSLSEAIFAVVRTRGILGILAVVGVVRFPPSEGIKRC